MNIKTLLFFTFLFLLSFTAVGQKKETAKKDTIKQKRKVKKDVIVKVRELSRQKDTVEIGQIIAIRLSTNKPIDSLNTLYIDGLIVKDLKPWKTSNCDSMVYFRLDHKVQTFVESIIGKQSAIVNDIPISISLGTTAKCLAHTPDLIYLKIKQKINRTWIWIMIVSVLGVTVAALRKNVLKDDNNLYYSLARTQLLFWTLLFSLAYIYICFVTGLIPEITTSALTILGISIGTTGVSKVIENRDNEIAIIDKAAKSEGWFMDILSDGTSINVQRLQTVIFNFSFGIIFIQSVVKNLIIPSFDSNALLLLGISSGAYAALKATESIGNQKQSSPPVGTDPVPPKPDSTAQAPVG